MIKRIPALALLGLALGVMAIQAQDLFVLPGVGSDSGNVAAFATSPLSEITTFSAGNNSFLVLPSVDAATFYVIANSTTDTVTATGQSFTAPVVLGSFTSPATAAIVTPDGNVLAVAAGTLHLFSTASSSELVTGGLSQGAGMTTFGVASSLDSTTLFAIGSTSTGGGELTAFSASTHAITGSLALTQAATALSVGPNGLVYVSLPNQILEINPTTLEPTPGGTISVSGTPGPLVFTPDGKYALAVNQSALEGSALLVVALATHNFTAPSLGLPQLTTLRVIGTDTVLALGSQGLFKITLGNPSAATVLQITGVSNAIQAFTVSNEVPATGGVQYLYAASDSDIYQISLATNQSISGYPISANVSAGALSYAPPSLTTQQSNPTTLLTYGASQIIPPNATTEPLVVQVLDGNKHPIRGVQVQFQSSSSSAPLSTTSATTGSNGYALTYLTAPATTGSFTVTATAGLLSANFLINVSATTGSNTPVLSIVAGQGQLLNANTNTEGGTAYGSPLEVLLTDANGNPLIGVPVTFTAPASAGTIVVGGLGGSTETANTGANGIAVANFLTTSLPPSNSSGYIQTTVTASASGSNDVIFYLTTVNESPGPSVYILAPTAGTILTGAEGSTLAGAVSVQVVSSAGALIPNVSLSLNDGNPDPSLFATVSCAGGIVLTNSNGDAVCNVVFGPHAGSGTFSANIGYTQSSHQFSFKTTTGGPAVVQIVQGNNQAGGPGQTLPLALLVHVTDSGGNTLTGQPVTWAVVNAGTVTLSNVVSTTDGNGNASALATLGSVGGVAQVTVTAGSASATFNLTVNIPTAGLQKVSGDQQSTTVSTAFPLPLTVEVVDASGNGLAGAQVNFGVTAGAATLSSASAVTGSNGQASITVTAGATAGAITVTASISTFNVTFNLTAHLAGPGNITIINGASFNPNTGISPGGIATIRGVGILPGVTGILTPPSGSPYPTTFSGVTITFDGTPAPIYYVEDTNGADQVTVQVPFEVQPGTDVSLVVNVANEPPATVPITVKPLAPGIFTSVYDGKVYAVAVRPDGSQVSPTNPAQRGETIQLYVTGLGQATPAIATGAAGVANQSITAPLIVGLNNGGVPLITAVYGPGLVGIYVVILQVPENTPTGPYQPIGVVAYDSSNNAYFAQATYIPIQ
ncbi:MAG: Ig-like domain-containing protein [Bryobacteraceae bacterium]